MLEFPRLRLTHRVLTPERTSHLHRLMDGLLERQRLTEALPTTANTPSANSLQQLDSFAYHD